MSLSVHQIQFAYNNILSFMSETTILSSIMSPFSNLSTSNESTLQCYLLSQQCKFFLKLYYISSQNLEYDPLMQQRSYCEKLINL